LSGRILSVADLSKLLWGLAELKVWPGRPWMQEWLAGGLCTSEGGGELCLVKGGGVEDARPVTR
jgi:hypothetical protein